MFRDIIGVAKISLFSTFSVDLDHTKLEEKYEGKLVSRKKRMKEKSKKKKLYPQYAFSSISLQRIFIMLYFPSYF